MEFVPQWIIRRIEFQRTLTKCVLIFALIVISLSSSWATAQVNLTNGLVAHWEFEENSSDSTGNGYDGQEFGNVQYRDGVVGKALYLQASSDFVAVEQDIIFGDFSISMYVNFEAFAVSTGSESNPANIALSWMDTSDFEILGTWFNNANNQDGLTYLGFQQGVVVRPALLELDQWRHYVITGQGQTLRVYRDGNLIIETQEGTTEGAAARYLTLGARQGCYQGCFDTSQGLFGYLDDLRVYDRILNTDEINLLSQSLLNIEDTDNDGLSDLQEESTYNTDANFKDTDFDGLEDGEEVLLQKDPTNPDFDILLSTTASDTSCAVRDGEIYCWGGDSVVIDPANYPATTDITDIDVGRGGIACVVDDGLVKCWGTNPSWSGVTYDVLNIPASVTSLRAKSISVGFTHACALFENDTGQCWGQNQSGSLNIPALSNPKQLLAAGHYSCVLDDNGVRCWGDNYLGRASPPSNLVNPKFIAEGGSTNCVIHDNGVSCWGNNSRGQRDAPTDFVNPKNLAIGNVLSCAIDDNGVRCWGGNDNGELSVPALTQPRLLTAGTYHACALAAEGLRCWGDPTDGRTNPQAEMQAPLDLDKDGLADDYELANGLDPLDPSDSSPDTDNDGLPDGYEVLHGLDPSDPNDAALDQDGDGLSALEEFGIGTNPHLADTDSDGIEDGEEIVAGQDGFITNPLLADSDEDGQSDLDEILSDLDPLDSSDNQVDLSGGLTAHISFEDSPNDVSSNGYDGEVFGDARYISGVVGKGIHFKDATQYLGIERDLILNDFTLSTYINVQQLANSITGPKAGFNTIYSGANPTEENELRVGVGRDGTENSVSLKGGRVTIDLTAPSIGEWRSYTLVRRNGVLYLYLNDQLLGKSGSLTSQQLDITYLILGLDQDCERGCFDANQSLFGYIDEFKIYNRALNLAEIDLLVEPVAAYVDSDGDGISDQNEINIYNTDPNSLDTDGDGIEDGEEANQYHTNPILSDSDGDGISDSDEIQYGLNPNDSLDSEADQDGDGIANGWEVANGLDPTNSADAQLDPDNDTLSNLDEFLAGSDINLIDTDFDGLEDSEEVLLNKNPTVKDLGVLIANYHTTNCAVRNSTISCWGPDGQVTDPAKIPTVTDVTQIDVGAEFACVIDENRLKCWGKNNFGVLDIPSEVANSDVLDIGTGGSHACALLSDHTVSCWGENFGGSLSVPALNKPTQITVGHRYACALTEDGVICFGNNFQGRTNPPSNLLNPRYVDASAGHACALDDTGVRCWGYNNFGQINVPSLSNVKALSVGDGLSCAIDENGVHCWGDNRHGGRNVPYLANPRLLATGHAHACAVLNEGVSCWGFNLDTRLNVPLSLSASLDLDEDGIADDWEVANGLNQLTANDAILDVDGDGRTALQEFQAGTDPNDRDEDGIINAEEIAQGYDIDNPDQDGDGILDGWEVANGLDPTNINDAQLDPDADGLSNLAEFTNNGNPFWKDSDFDGLEDSEEVASGSNLTMKDFGQDIASNASTNCGIRDNEIHCWGTDTTNIANAASIPMVTAPVEIGVGFDFACVLDAGEVKCWGADTYGVISNVTAVNDNLGDIVDLAIGSAHACAIDQSNKVLCWGASNSDRLFAPTLLDPIQISSIADHTCALDKEGVKCWGFNASGQATVPNDLVNPRFVAAGELASCAIDDTGVRCWGQDTYGVLSNLPTDWLNPRYLVMSEQHACGIDDNGMRCWGDNTNGELNVPSLDQPTLIALGSDHSCALSSQSVRCWGVDDSRIVVPDALLDKTKPFNVRELAAEVISDTEIELSWLVPTFNADDIEKYKIQVAGGQTYEIDAPALSINLPGLIAETTYSATLSTIDAVGNESDGVNIEFATPFPHPTSLASIERSNRIDLSWVQPADLSGVREYRIYTNSTTFTDVAGMNPELVVGSDQSSVTIGGLSNGQQYFIAITTVNISGYQVPLVSPITATPDVDSQPPEFASITFNQSPLLDGLIAANDGDFCAVVTDLSAISRVNFSVDGNVIATDANADGGYCYNIKLSDFDDGAHQLTISAYDVYENVDSRDFAFTIQLALPPAPQLTSPATGYRTNQSVFALTGISTPGLDAQVLVNGVAGDWFPVNATGQFTQDVTLASEGANVVTARSRNRSGEGAESGSIEVILDTSLPAQPIGLRAEGKPDGVVRLQWSNGPGGEVTGYNLYRSDTEVFDIPTTGKVNSALISGLAFEDLLLLDGTYNYKVVAISDLGTASEPSSTVSIDADSTPPIATSITYSTTGAFDSLTQTYGRGTLTTQLTVSEPLLATPFLSIAPDGGVPINVPLELISSSQNQYSGSIELTEATNSGVAYAVFSARDRYGNRGTEVEAGQQINIDTHGPRVTALTSSPESPIENDQLEPVTVSVTAQLSEVLENNLAPDLMYSLSHSNPTPAPLSNIVNLGGNLWQADLLLPANAGLEQPEVIEFYFSGNDALGNSGTEIEGSFVTQVYQGDLPPLDAPFNFRGQALSSGRVSLEWFEVEGAEAYQLYRKAPGETELSAYQRLPAVDHFIDQTSVDGEYEYQLASIRVANGEESLSARTESVIIDTDSSAPSTPQGLGLELFPIGIQAEWTPVSETGLSYRVYRAASGPITATEGLTPLFEDLTEPFVVDTNATQQLPAYVVVAVDATGNESAPSNTAYLNVDLLPVSSLKVRLEEGGIPSVSWSHTAASIGLYDIFLGIDDLGTKLNGSVITTNSFDDVGFANKTRSYAVVAIDANDQRSLARSITLPELTFNPVPEQTIKRNLVNSVDFSVTNLSDQPVANAQIKLIDGSQIYQSSKFSINAQQSITVPIVVGGLESFPDIWNPSLELHAEPNAGERIEIAKPITLDVLDGALNVSLETADFVRGSTGQTRFILENTGDQAIQLITSRSFGNNNSADVVFTLVDSDENVLALSPFKQILGEGVVNAASGEAIATIQAGERWTSDEVSVTVPSSAPDEVFLALQINNMYANRGTGEEVRVKGPATRQRIVLEETDYKGVVSSVTPESSFGEETILIRGQSIYRETGEVIPNVDLKVIISLAGFERIFEVLTDDLGEFELSYQPQPGESGRYKVSVLHPVLTSRPVDAEFVVNRLSISPNRLSLRIPYIFDYSLPVSFTAGDGTVLNNLRFELRAEDQANGQIPQGFSFTFPTIASMVSGQRISSNIQIRAEETAVENGQFIISVFSDERADQPIGSIDVVYQLSTATPALFYQPNVLELGTTLDGTASGTIALENRGLVALKDVNLRLRTGDGFPAFDWINLVTQSSLGDIGIGETKTADIVLQPNNAAPVGVESFVLEVTSSNAPMYSVPIFTAVSESGEGGALLKITDMYSGTLDGLGRVIQGLSNANVRIQNEAIPSIEYQVKSDDLGEVFIEDIPAGRYSVWVSAPNYQEQHRRIRIQPGLIKTEQIFLDYQLIRLEWSVNEITIQDRYEIVLRATFETDVPAAVVMIEPTTIPLPAMEVGDVFYGELQMTNYGLIRAYDIDFSPQQSDEFFQFEYLSSVIPDALEAKEQIIIPYKITALSSLEQQDGSGGGCGVYSKCAACDAKSMCPTGESSTHTQSCVTQNYGTCSVGTSSPPTRPNYNGGGSTGNGDGGGSSDLDPLPPGFGLPPCRPDGGDCGNRRGGS